MSTQTHTPTEQTVEPLVDAREAARFLKVSYSAFLAWVSRGSGPPGYVINDPRSTGQPGRKPRHVYRFRLSELEKWLKDRRIPSRGKKAQGDGGDS